MSKQTFDYKQAIQSSLEYFNNDQLAADVFVSKYAMRNSNGELVELNPTFLFERASSELARIESKYPNPLSKEFIFEKLSKFEKIVLQGSPMAAIGNLFQVQSFSNCYVIPSPADSYGGILNADQHLVQIMKRRGGVGVDISKIRPKGMFTNNAAKTTDGIGVFMERFSNTTREVAQEGRRGALMETISIHHPEIEKFIDIKQDKTKVTGANISVKVTDEFMKALHFDLEYEQRWPVDSVDPKIKKTVKAKEIWDKIIKCAWNSAEPGVLFWDTITRGSPADCYSDVGYKTESTNPCQPGWATLLTPKGIVTFNDIKIGDIIWSGKQWTKVVNKLQTGIKSVFAYRTTAGTFYGTENHRVVSKGVKIEAKKAKNLDLAIVERSFDKMERQIQAIMDGLVIGDGMVHKASNNKVFLCVGENDSDYFTSEIADLFVEKRDKLSKTAWDVKTTITELPKTFDRFVPDKYRFGNESEVCSFLRGLYSANGAIVSDRITLKASSFKIIENVQEMLSSLGISSYYTTNKKKNVEFKNGIYECKQSYDLNITNSRSQKIFKNAIGFLQKYKQEKLNNLNKKDFGHSKITYDINNIEFIAEEPVFDITVEAKEHTYWTGGMLVSNCSELPLAAYDSCRLLLINTLSYVKNPFTKKSEFDWEEFKKDCAVAQRLMDDIVDLELESIQKILNKIDSDPESDDIKKNERDLWQNIYIACKNGRRTGTGLTAIGDTVAALGLCYGSDDSVSIVEKIYKTLALSAYESSIVLAKERGAFPVFDINKEIGHPFLEQIHKNLPQESLEQYKQTGRRNIALLTTAPAGSVSILTQTTSGIEPVFMLKYDRWKKVNPSDKDVKIDRVDAQGDSWQKFTVYHHGFKKWMDVTGKNDIEESPYYKATANEIDWKASVKLQAAAQKWIDHAISKTCNLPKDVPLDVVSDCYKLAWEMGCKGFTVYREGSRDGVLTSSEQSNQSIFVTHSAPKRPDELECEVHRANVAGEAWTIFLGLMDGKPYEIMGGLSRYIDLPRKIKTGYIKKNRKKSGNSYDFVANVKTEDEIIIKDLSTVFENPSYGAFTRTISLALRHGTPVQYVVEQLQKGDKDSDLFSFSKVMSRVLKGKIVDGTKVASKCKECDSENLEYREGCATCMNCGYSKCG